MAVFLCSRNVIKPMKSHHPSIRSTRGFWRPLLLLTVASRSISAESSSSPNTRLLQIQVIHRHGDRTPITPLKDEEFWSSKLVGKDTLGSVSSNTQVLRETTHSHKARGRGPFGQLTQRGLLQMIQLGTSLREKYSGDDISNCIWTPDRLLHPSTIQIFSTNFDRTIQSVKGLLVGLFPDSTAQSIVIDARQISWMIPDPQPRQTKEQEMLEHELGSQHVEQENDMVPLALRTTQALQHLLADDAHHFNFGVDKDDDPEQESIEVEPLAWNQLAEITTCLAAYQKLPPTITPEDVHAITTHAAKRWFRNLRHPRLVYLSMNTMAQRVVDILLDHVQKPPCTIWSAHDSTLVGLLCAFRLEQPKVWPEYASCLILELLEVTNGDTVDYMVRFLLNGERLRSVWENEAPMDMIPLKLLAEKIRTEGATAPSVDTS